MSKIKPFWSLTVLLSLSSIILFWRLGLRTLVDWDEAIYARVAREILLNQDWITLHWGYKPWFHKPPLFMWATAIVYQVLGISEFSARAASALSGIGIVALTYGIAITLYDRVVAWLSCLVLLSSYLFIYLARFGTTDAMLTAWMLLSIYGYIKLKKDKKQAWWLVIWIGFGLACMTKGVASIVLLITLILALALDRNFEFFKSRSFWIGALIFSGIVLPWHITIIAQHGGAFLKQYFGYHVIARATEGIESHNAPPEFYFNVLQENFFPWFYLLPPAIILALPDRFSRNSGFRVMLVFLAVVFCLYTVIQTKLTWYILPIIPIASIFSGSLLGQTYLNQPLAIRGTTFAVLVSVLYGIPKINFLPTKTGTIVSLLLFILISLVCISASIVNSIKWQRPVSILMVVLLFLFGLREIRGLYTPLNNPIVRLARIAKTDATQSSSPLLIVNLSENLDVPTPLFYSERPIDWIREPEKLNQTTNSREYRDAILGKRDIVDLSTQYEFKIIAQNQSLIYTKIKKRGG